MEFIRELARNETCARGADFPETRYFGAFGVSRARLGAGWCLIRSVAGYAAVSDRFQASFMPVQARAGAKSGAGCRRSPRA